MTRRCWPAVVIAAFAATIPAQCDPWVVPGPAVEGANGDVWAFVEWDPDGPGPLTEQLVVAGWFHGIGTVGARGLARFDPVTSTWHKLGDVEGYGQVYALAVAPNGSLVVGGLFTSIDGVAASSIASFDGTTWSPLGGGLQVLQGPATVNAIATLPNGDVVATGDFDHAGFVPAAGFARWDGSAWSAFGNLSAGGSARCLQEMPNGDLVLGGSFSSVAGVAANNIARFDGTTWHPLGSGLQYSSLWPVRAFDCDVMSTGELVVIGAFDLAGGVPTQGIATWNGTTWTNINTPWQGGAFAIRVLANGDLVLGGWFSNGPVSHTVVRLHAGVWQGLGFGVYGAHAIAELPNGTLVVGGQGLWRHTGTQWTAFTSGTDRPPEVVLQLRDGRTFAAGTMSSINSVPVTRAAFGVHGNWSDAGLYPPLTVAVTAATELPDGRVVVTTNYNGSGAIAVQSNGGWSGIGGVSAFTPPRLIATADGALVLCGGNGGLDTPRVWHGGVWRPLVDGLLVVPTALCSLPHGRVAIAGSLLSAPGVSLNNVAIWNGHHWDALAGGTSEPPTALAAALDGSLVAVGPFQTAGAVAVNGAARWDGTSWTALGSGFANLANGDLPATIASLPNGDLLVGGTFASVGGVPARNLARWDGTAWHAIGTGADGHVRSIAAGADGSIALGGEFGNVDGTTSAFVAQFVAPCAVQASSVSVGCVQNSQPLTLAVTNDAYIGGALETIATGMPNLGIGVACFGLFPWPQSPLLSSIVPQGLPCSWTVQPIVARLAVPVQGSARTTLPIPRAAPLIGQVMLHQMLSVALSPHGAITSIGGTNGLAITIGALW